MVGSSQIRQLDSQEDSDTIKLRTKQGRVQETEIPAPYKPIIEWCIKQLHPDTGWTHRTAKNLCKITDVALAQTEPGLLERDSRNAIFKAALGQ